MTAIDTQLAALAARRQRRADKRREIELEGEVKRLRAAYDAALRNAVLSKQYGLGRTPAAYVKHENAWAWAEAVDAERQDVWSPFGRCWR